MRGRHRSTPEQQRATEVLAAAAPKAAVTLSRLLQTSNDSVRLRAAMSILDRVLGAPKAAVAQPEPEQREPDAGMDLRQQVAILERALLVKRRELAELAQSEQGAGVPN